MIRRARWHTEAACGSHVTSRRDQDALELIGRLGLHDATGWPEPMVAMLNVQNEFASAAVKPSNTDYRALESGSGEPKEGIAIDLTFARHCTGRTIR